MNDMTRLLDSFTTVVLYVRALCPLVDGCCPLTIMGFGYFGAPVEGMHVANFVVVGVDADSVQHLNYVLSRHPTTCSDCARPCLAGMLMHAPSCSPDCTLALSVPCVGLSGSCWQSVGEDSSDACISSDPSLLGGSVHHGAHVCRRT